MILVTDEELRRQLNRRTTAVLGDREREELLAGIGLATRIPASPRRWWITTARWLAPAAVLVTLAIIVAPLALPAGPLSSSPAPSDPSLSPGSTPAESGVPTQEPESAPHVFRAQELSDMIGGSHVGDVVLAQVRVTETDFDPRTCPPQALCRTAVLADVTGPNVVETGWRSADQGEGTSDDEGSGFRWITRVTFPADSGLFAFKILADAVEYLGPVLRTVDGGILRNVEQMQAGENSHASNVVFPVQGWLVATSPGPCVSPPRDAPQGADQSYWCGRSWLTQQSTYAVSENRTAFSMILDGLHAQWDAYDNFAQHPVLEGPRGAEPRFGTYLVRSGGCPPVVMGNCPVWSMVGRLDDASVDQSAFPQAVGGERVLTLSEATERAFTSDSAEPFLLGGWIAFVGVDCFVPDDFPFTPLLVPCHDGYVLSDAPSGAAGSVHLVLPDNGPAGLPNGQNQPVVLRVHTHDARSSGCPDAYRASCERAIVVEEVVWPAVYEPPTPPPGAEMALPHLAIGNWTTLVVSVVVNGKDIVSVGPGEVVNPVDARLLPEFPWSVEGTTASGRVLLTLTVNADDVWSTGPDPSGASSDHGVARRAELSCGRLDIWSGPPLLGPMPPTSFPPHDCDP